MREKINTGTLSVVFRAPTSSLQQDVVGRTRAMKNVGLQLKMMDRDENMTNTEEYPFFVLKDNLPCISSSRWNVNSVGMTNGKKKRTRSVEAAKASS